MPQFDFDVLVIGAGAAGLTASGLAAALGAKTAILERARPGGDCTWAGCVPSKALIQSAKIVHTIRTSSRFGIVAPEFDVDFPKIMAAMRDTRERIYRDVDSPDRIAERNIELIPHGGRFVDPHTLELDDEGGRRITSRYVVICAGSSPVVPRIAGLPGELILTNESIFEIDELPARLLVVGAGPVGIEMAQAFRRFGSQVAVVDNQREILQHDEPECSEFVREQLISEGVRFHLGSTIDAISRDDRGYFAQISTGDQWSTERFDRVFVAAGRSPNTKGLDLESAGVEYTEKGITINHSCQTSASHIYACGDIADGLNFTHVAENMAKTAVIRLLLKAPASFEKHSVPWVTFTDPESAHLGKTAEQLTEEKERFETIRFPYERIDRAITDRAEDGFVMIHSSPSSGKLLGAHVVGSRAGEMINELSLAMNNGITLREISDTIHAYPTYLLGARRAADQWYVRHSPTGLMGTVKRIFGYRGEIPSSLGSDEIV